MTQLQGTIILTILTIATLAIPILLIATYIRHRKVMRELWETYQHNLECIERGDYENRKSYQI